MRNLKLENFEKKIQTVFFTPGVASREEIFEIYQDDTEIDVNIFILVFI